MRGRESTGRSRLLGAHRAAPPGATGQLFNARLREKVARGSQGPPGRPGKRPIARGAPSTQAGSRRQNPAQQSGRAPGRTEEKTAASRSRRAGCVWLQLPPRARGMASLSTAGSAASCCPRSDSTAGSAHPGPDPRKMLHHRPGKEMPACSPPSRASRSLRPRSQPDPSAPFLPLVRVDSLLQCLPLWSPRSSLPSTALPHCRPSFPPYRIPTSGG